MCAISSRRIDTINPPPKLAMLVSPLSTSSSRCTTWHLLPIGCRPEEKLIGAADGTQECVVKGPVETMDVGRMALRFGILLVFAGSLGMVQIDCVVVGGAGEGVAIGTVAHLFKPLVGVFQEHDLLVEVHLGAISLRIFTKVLDLSNAHFTIIGSHSQMVQERAFISDASTLLVSRFLRHG